MTKSDVINRFIYPALEELRDDLKHPELLVLAPETTLFGSRSALDSLNMVSLLVEIESLIADELDVSIVLANEKAMSRQHSPFRSVDTLSDYIVELLAEEGI